VTNVVLRALIWSNLLDMLVVLTLYLRYARPRAPAA